MSQKRYSYGALISAAIGSFVLAGIIFHPPGVSPGLATKNLPRAGRGSARGVERSHPPNTREPMAADIRAPKGYLFCNIGFLLFPAKIP